MRAIEILKKYFKEDDETFLTGLYRELLGRDPDHEGFLYHLNNLRKNGDRIAVYKEMVMSKEFSLLMSRAKIFHVLQKIASKKDYEFVRTFYLNMYGRVPSLSQVQMDAINIQNHTLSKSEFIQSKLLGEEFLTQLIQHDAFYEPEFSIICKIRLILRLASKECIERLKTELLEIPSESKLSDVSMDQLTNVDYYKFFVASEQFRGQLSNNTNFNCLTLLQRIIHLTDDEFLFEVYREGLGREPDAWGFKYFTQQIKNGVKKLDIIREIFTGVEASNILHPKREGNFSSPQNNHLNHKQHGFRKGMEVLLEKNLFPFKTNIIYKSGGMGDFIQMTPVAKALKEKYPDYPVVAAVGGVYGSYVSILEDHPYIDATMECRNYGLNDEEAIRALQGLTENLFDLRYISRSYGKQENVEFLLKNSWYYDNYPYSGCRISDFNMHVCDLMLHSLGLEAYANCNDVCVTPEEVPEEIPGDYVVVCNNVGSIAGQLREWVSEEWAELILWLHEQGIIPVQLGTNSDVLIHPGVMDLRGKTTLRQAAGYLKLSKGYIGIEGGLFHLAKAVGSPTVVIFASTTPCSFAYPETFVVTKNVCHPCWWAGSWINGECIHGCQNCLNLPDWKSVSEQVSKMLDKRRES